MAFGGVMLAVVLVMSRNWRRFGWGDVGWMLLPAAAFAIDLMIWHRSIHAVGPGLATLLGNFQVFVMALAGVLLHRERLGPRFIAGLALAFAGIWLLVGVDWRVLEPQYRVGVLFGILTGVAYAIYMLSFRDAQQRRRGLDSSQLLCLNSLLCALMLAAAVTYERTSFAIPNLHSLVALLALGLVGQVLGWTLIVRAIPLLPVSLVGLLLLLQPSLSFVLDVLLFARPTAARDWIGVAISLIGIYLGSTRGAGVSRDPEGAT
jgi:drug/metabolite transporter (DMT)-like permease